MKKTKRNKTKMTATISLAFILVFSALFTILPTTFAQTTLPGYTPMPDRETQTEVAASPTIVGVGQPVTINIMTYPGPSGPTYEAQHLVSSLHGGFDGITITIKDPDGQEETFMPIDETLAQVGVEVPGKAQIVGHLQFQYTPTKTGEYTLTASFPGEFYTTDNIYAPAKLSVYFKPSSSTQPETFTVVEDTVLAGLLNGYPWSPLPEGYWEDPVETDNREWYEVSGDWLQTEYDIGASNYNPYSTSPNSPHILWGNKIVDGGLPGGVWGSLPYTSGSKTPIILNGKIYQNSKSGYFECVDLRTGEQLWEVPGSVDGAMRIDPAYQTASQEHEGYIDSWLWSGLGTGFIGQSSSTWKCYDPFDGDLKRTIVNVPTDLMGIRYEDGNPYIFCVQASLSTWNTTLPMKISYANLIKWDYSQMFTRTGAYGIIRSDNWQDGVVWNVSIMQDDIVSIGDNNFWGPKVYPYWGAGVVLVKTHNAMQIMAAYDYDTGAFLWKNNHTVLNNDVRPYGIATSPSGPYLMHDAATPNFVAYDLKTGQEIWRASSGELPWAMLPSYSFAYHDGVHFLGSYDGHVYAYASDDGHQVWVSDYIGEEFETIYNNQPFNYGAAGADGKLYFSTQTTYSMMPRPRFQKLVCIDEYTGKYIWELPIGIRPTAIADGYLLGSDYDNGIQYVIGKGKTEMTVEAPLTDVPKGTGIAIRGTVMDLSPGAPNTPAVSEEDMAMWMDYMYGQNATLINDPPRPNGVSVTLNAVDADGNLISIGTTTSSMDGTYGIEWTPPEEGLYKIVASFLGSDSYYSSYSTTYLLVGPAPSGGQPIETEEPTTEAPTTEAPTTEAPTSEVPTTEQPSGEAPAFPTTEVIIIAAVVAAVVIGVGAYWALRRRK